ncbi:CBS domain-containing protein [Nocardia mexicana]|uniref:CBS domain protein n=1 Tax=Nocardia mexicana TaxID=279262 RepID=A0A370GI51_9NOCA|nr:CBS domain-containing protein [Nocardia mexicana]RDI43327.1 CBS domain protein [Nocardia mexicana]
MTTARDIMHAGVEIIHDHDSLAEAARRMRDRGIGALPICDTDGRPIGIVTDRDIVIRCLATGANPEQVSAAKLAQGTLHTVSPDTDTSAVLELMRQHRIRRLPVLEHNRLVGIITEGDLARRLPEEEVGEFIEAVCAP